MIPWICRLFMLFGEIEFIKQNKNSEKKEQGHINIKPRLYQVQPCDTVRLAPRFSLSAYSEL